MSGDLQQIDEIRSSPGAPKGESEDDTHDPGTLIPYSDHFADYYKDRFAHLPKNIEDSNRLRALYFCVEVKDNSDRDLGFDWYILNLERREISNLDIPAMFLSAQGFIVAPWWRHLFVLGGTNLHDDEFRNEVLHFDPNCGKWINAAPMICGRSGEWDGKAISTQEKVYVFSSLAAEVFDVFTSRWSQLPGPTSDITVSSYPAVYDSSRRGILVHFHNDRSLHIYRPHNGSWEEIDEVFGIWHILSVVVDGILICLRNEDVDYHFSGQKCSLMAYNLDDKDWLPTKWVSGFEINVPSFDTQLFHLFDGNLCLVSAEVDGIKYLEFRVMRKEREEGEVIEVVGVSDSMIHVPFLAPPKCDPILFTAHCY